MGLQIEEQRQLIEKFVKANVKFEGNEDLLEDFCNEAYQKSYIIFNSSSSIQKIESYIQKVVNTSIIGVLKDSGRLKKTSSGYVRTKEIPLEETKQTTDNKKLPQEFIYEIEDPRVNFEENIIKKELLQKIVDAVCLVHSEDPKKCYLDLYEARYVKGLKQKEIAKELNISQSEVSKRLIELSKLIKVQLKA
ncbi:MAG: sigma-70 family RNA polymerase sigma factor [Candidatus Gastranaerophilaceae bacterium]